jgi:hypothetical protein
MLQRRNVKTFLHPPKSRSPLQTHRLSSMPSAKAWTVGLNIAYTLRRFSGEITSKASGVRVAQAYMIRCMFRSIVAVNLSPLPTTEASSFSAVSAFLW